MYKFEPFYRIKVEKVTDGDTLVISFYLGLGIWLNDQKVRLLGIDTPEVRGETREQGLKSSRYMSKLLSESTDVIVKTDEKKKGKYGRFLVIVFGKMNGKWVNINKLLVSSGAAREYMASDVADVEELFNPLPSDIEDRVVVDETKTELEVYNVGDNIVEGMLTLAKEILNERRGLRL